MSSTIEYQKQTATQQLTLLKQLTALTQAVNQTLLQHYASTQALKIDYKTDDSPVTAADIAAHHQIVAGLAQIAPHIPVLSEESVASQENIQRKTWHTFWIVDPLDGTKEFIHRTDEFTVNIALVVDGVVQLSALGVPVNNVVYVAIRGQGAFKVVGDDWQPLHPPKSGSIDSSVGLRIAISRRPSEKELQTYQDFFTHLKTQNIKYSCIEAGSAYKFGLMVEGLIDVYPRLHPTSEWDTAAGQGILEALGGALVTLSGKPFVYNQRDSLLNGKFMAVRTPDMLKMVL